MIARARWRPQRAPSPMRGKSTKISASGRVRSCGQILEFIAARLCSKQSPPSAFCGVDELPRRFDRAKTAEIFVTAAGEADELLWFVGKRKQPFAENDGNRGVVAAVHDQQRNLYVRDALIRPELI